VNISFPLRVGHLKNQKVLDLFATRLKKFRATAGLSIKQVSLATGISKRHIELTESGVVNTSIGYATAYAELFGVELHTLLNFKEPFPEESAINAAVKKYVKVHGVDAGKFYKSNEGATHTIDKLLKTAFLNQPRYTKDIADYCKEKYNVEFTTTRLSKVLDNLHKEGRVDKLATDKKSKFQYRKK
jgi:transcriptional regulator with XRE-family HTH domain